MKSLILPLLLIAASADAQDRSVVEQAKASLQAKGVDLSGPCGALKITNLVAWELRPRFGLLHKAGGNRGVLKADGSCLTGEQTSDPEGYASDYLIDRSTGFGFDILGDGGGANNPQWAGPEDGPDMVARNWSNYREPLDPGFLLAPPPPPVFLPPPPPVFIPPPPPLPSTDLSTVLARLSAIESRMAALEEQQKATREDIASFRSAAKNTLKVILKYAGPAIAALVAGRQMGAK